ncbi:MAG: hypothetical protein JO368_00230 [Acidimicrobiales bacterium]|nr:hypothetical protein [Acidimicrobiales bacterium]
MQARVENPSPWASSAASRLRAKYRCTMCHKQCRVPCQFTVAEFDRLLEAAIDEDEGLP